MEYLRLLACPVPGRGERSCYLASDKSFLLPLLSWIGILRLVVLHINLPHDDQCRQYQDQKPVNLLESRSFSAVFTSVDLAVVIHGLLPVMNQRTAVDEVQEGRTLSIAS